ncbi:MAG: hypothetical protein ACJAYS_001028 [Lentimonas sp.]|jgi:hypothetical protein
MSSTQTINASKLSELPIIKIGLLTLFFVGMYFVLRALPDAQCGFLHYEEIVHPDGTIEFCATNHAGFLDLTLLEYPVAMEISLVGKSAKGTEQEVTLELLTPGGMPIAPHELAITHTEKLHVMVIDPSLVDYYHVHPQPEGISGKYTFTFTPKRAGTYRILAEIVPLLTRRQVIASGTIDVEGLEDGISFERRTESTVDQVHFVLNDVPESMQTGIDYRFELDVLTAEGNAVVLEDIMGAKGHMVAFDAERKGFAHMHPIDSVLSTEPGSSDSELAFLFNVPNPGWYRLFSQVQVEGRVVFGSFDLKIE